MAAYLSHRSATDLSQTHSTTWKSRARSRFQAQRSSNVELVPRKKRWTYKTTLADRNKHLVSPREWLTNKFCLELVAAVFQALRRAKLNPQVMMPALSWSRVTYSRSVMKVLPASTFSTTWDKELPYKFKCSSNSLPKTVAREQKQLMMVRSDLSSFARNT